jgi:protoporphyrinogen oxidase
LPARYDGKFHRFVDPWRRPRHLFKTAFSPLASFADKLRVARLRLRVSRGSLDELYSRPEKITLAKLREEGFSNRIVERFFKPFLGGVFLENELSTSSRKFEFVFRMFSQGDDAMPSKGMGALAEQIAARLPPDTVQTNTKVAEVNPRHVRLENGQGLSAANVVIACEAPVAARLLGEEPPAIAHGVTCLYSSADSPPINEPILVLNGEGRGPINNLCGPSQVIPDCAPHGKSLISVTVLKTTTPEQEPDLRIEVLSQLREWYGSIVDSWEHLKTYRIPYALPNQNPTPQTAVPNAGPKANGIFMCGDYLDTASIQGAMVSGRRAAESILGI